MPERMQYLLPDLGEGMTEAELVQWRVAVGDHVTRDQIVAHVQTDKAEVELPVPAAGTIVALGAAVGDLVPVGAPLLELEADAGTALGGTSVRGAPATTPTRLRDPRDVRRSDASVQAAPPVRKLARELGIDLATVVGTGPGGQRHRRRRARRRHPRGTPARGRGSAGATAGRAPGDGAQHGGGVARGAAHFAV